MKVDQQEVWQGTINQIVDKVKSMNYQCMLTNNSMLSIQGVRQQLYSIKSSSINLNGKQTSNRTGIIYFLSSDVKQPYTQDVQGKIPELNVKIESRIVKIVEDIQQVDWSHNKVVDIITTRLFTNIAHVLCEEFKGQDEQYINAQSFKILWKLMNTQYVNSVIEYIKNFLVNVKCKVKFINMPVNIDSNDKPFVVKGRKFGQNEDNTQYFNDQDKTLYFYSVGLGTSLGGIADTNYIDYIHGEVLPITEQDFLKTFYIRYHYGD